MYELNRVVHTPDLKTCGLPRHVQSLTQYPFVNPSGAGTMSPFLLDCQYRLYLTLGVIVLKPLLVKIQRMSSIAPSMTITS